MKKYKIHFFLISFLLFTGTFAFAQNNKVLQIYKNGAVSQSIEVAKIDSIKFTEMLSAPANVTARLSGNVINITWDAVNNATSYEVYRSSDNSNYNMLAANITTNAYMDNLPFSGTNYYKVKAISATNSSPLSAASPVVSFANSNERIYTGVVAFNSDVSIFPISNDLEATKAFISSKTNDIDRTALCYAVSKSVTLFGTQGLPSFNKIFVVSFTDGIDNGSSSLYVRDGRQVVQGLVYDTAHVDLAKKTGLDAYTIGFGDQPLAASMQKLIIGKGEYKQSYSTTLNATFQEIAQSVIASSKNVVLRTQDGLYTAAYPKYVKLTINSTAGTDVVIAKIVGYTLSIVTPGTYTSFDSPVTGMLNIADEKIDFPLNNLKFVKGGTEYQFTINVQMSYDNVTYYEDTEDTSTEEAIAKKIAVVLVLDCSTSLGDNFGLVQIAANNFIDVLLSEGNANDNNNPLIAAPTNVTAIQSGNTALVSWKGVDGAESYKVYRSSDNIIYNLIANNITATTYTDNAPQQGMNYYKVTALNSTAESAKSSSASVNYIVQDLKIGMSYQGGVIAYIDGTGQHGLIAAPTDQNNGNGVQWYNGSYISTGATATNYGSGMSNTNKIVAAQGEGYYAAKICSDLVLNGYDDWYLPSKDELYILYQNRTAIGGFTTSYYYWSSSDTGSGYAWKQEFWNGSQYNESKQYTNRIRAVRSF